MSDHHHQASRGLQATQLLLQAGNAAVLRKRIEVALNRGGIRPRRFRLGAWTLCETDAEQQYKKNRELEYLCFRQDFFSLHKYGTAVAHEWNQNLSPAAVRQP